MESAGKKLILVIDDDRDILEALKIVLEAEGFAVETAFDGKQGLAKVTDTKPDLVIVDMMMETVDAGVKVTEEIKKTGLQTPVILLSSIGEATSYNLDAAQLGFAGVIQKPIIPSVLIPLISKKLDMKA